MVDFAAVQKCMICLTSKVMITVVANGYMCWRHNRRALVNRSYESWAEDYCHHLKHRSLFLLFFIKRTPLLWSDRVVAVI